MKLEGKRLCDSFKVYSAEEAHLISLVFPRLFSVAFSSPGRSKLFSPQPLKDLSDNGKKKKQHVFVAFFGITTLKCSTLVPVQGKNR